MRYPLPMDGDRSSAIKVDWLSRKTDLGRRNSPWLVVKAVSFPKTVPANMRVRGFHGRSGREEAVQRRTDHRHLA